MLKRAKTIAERHFGKDHVEMADVLRNLANTYEDKKKLHKRFRILERALESKEKFYCKGHIQTANILESLAVTLGEMKDLKQEKYLLDQALKIKENFYGKGHPEVATVLTNIGMNHVNQGDSVTARILYEKSYSILLHHSYCGEHHVNTKKVKHQLNNLEFKLSSQWQEEIFKGTCFRGMFSKPTEKKIDSSLKELLEKYKLSDCSLSNLEKGLRRAASNNQVQDLMIFAEQVNNINAQDNGNDRKTALHWAVIKNAKYCIKALLEKSAKIDIPDASDKTAYDYAKENKDSEVLSLLALDQNKVSMKY